MTTSSRLDVKLTTPVESYQLIKLSSKVRIKRYAGQGRANAGKRVALAAALYER